ncbi:unnamed protein product [Linum tenue]|uniref:Uncharacterized protein n=1 Tax=Linum tenue TaxID=586396 RepID=A0AAV0LN94_9ROSI|nr:unnamed protein product [Linum tenue]
MLITPRNHSVRNLIDTIKKTLIVGVLAKLGASYRAGQTYATGLVGHVAGDAAAFRREPPATTTSASAMPP